jgi:hypothetical protein
MGSERSDSSEAVFFRGIRALGIGPVVRKRQRMTQPNYNLPRNLFVCEHSIDRQAVNIVMGHRCSAPAMMLRMSCQRYLPASKIGHDPCRISE